MIEDKEFDGMNGLEQDRTCEFWLTDKWANGYCRIVGKSHVCHFSEQSNKKCPIMVAYREGQKYILNKI